MTPKQNNTYILDIKTREKKSRGNFFSHYFVINYSKIKSTCNDQNSILFVEPIYQISRNSRNY